MGKQPSINQAVYYWIFVIGFYWEMIWMMTFWISICFNETAKLSNAPYHENQADWRACGHKKSVCHCGTKSPWGEFCWWVLCGGIWPPNDVPSTRHCYYLWCYYLWRHHLRHHHLWRWARQIRCHHHAWAAYNLACDSRQIDKWHNRHWVQHWFRDSLARD